MASDPFDPAISRPDGPDYAGMAALRAGDGVAKVPSGFWVVARYDDCRWGLKDVSTFSNEGGMRAVGVEVPDEERMINEMDPPDHTRLRRFEQTALNHGNFKDTEPFIRAQAERMVDGLAPGEPVDLVPALTGPLPGRVAAHVIGVPEPDSDRFRLWSIDVSTSEYVTHNRTGRGEGLHGGHPEFSAYIDGLVEQRRGLDDPPDDLVTRMIRQEIGGRRMSATELRIAIAHLIIAGNETTMNLIGNLLWRLLRDPELWARLRSDRSALPGAVDESLRYDAPVQNSVRTLTRDIEMCETAIPKGERVWLALASGNRDEAHFGPDADRFDVSRANAGDHLTFGMGPHLCLGAGLARAEARIVIETLFDRFETAGLAPGYRFEPLPSFWEYGPTRLDAVLK